MTRTCWKCGGKLTVKTIRWGRDKDPTPWFIHAHGTPVCKSASKSTN